MGPAQRQEDFFVQKQNEEEFQPPQKLSATSQSVGASQINDKWIEKYQSLYLEEHGHPIDKTKALDELTALLCFLNAVRKHANKNKL